MPGNLIFKREGKSKEVSSVPAGTKRKSMIQKAARADSYLKEKFSFMLVLIKKIS